MKTEINSAKLSKKIINNNNNSNKTEMKVIKENLKDMEDRK